LYVVTRRTLWYSLNQRCTTICHQVAVTTKFLTVVPNICVSSAWSWAGKLIWYSDWLRAGRSRDRNPVEARFSAPVQTGPGAHPASCTMGTGSFPGVKCGRGVLLTPHPLLVPWSRKSRAIPLLPLWAVRPVQSLSACTRVHFSFTFTFTFTFTSTWKLVHGTLLTHSILRKLLDFWKMYAPLV